MPLIPPSLGTFLVQALLLTAAATFGSTTPSATNPEVLWAIGKPDGFSIEFAPGSRSELTYKIGQSNVTRDFAGHQDGSIGFDGRKGEKPYTIVFDLREAPQGSYALLLDLIYKSGAPRQMQVKVNDKTGVFPIRHAYKKSGDGEEGNVMLMAQQHLVVPIEGAWLKPTGNRIVLAPLGLGGLEYDAVQFVRGTPDGAETLRAQPTVFYKKRGRRLVEICEAVVPFKRRFVAGQVTLQVGAEKVTRPLSGGEYDFGVLTEPVEVPAGTEPTMASIEVHLEGQPVVERHSFKPAKQWKLYVCPKVHNDVGYTDLQPHVNELDNRNTDQALAIMDRFPFYKFNFETGWLVDNYLDCRTESSKRHFFEYARHNRATINVLYLNLMTGLCTGEELYRAMAFTERLHRERGSSFDFACLTDAPSHTWFLPTLLDDVGVKCFSNGSNQTRAPILYHSDLNENSPFWWEGMNGERIFMWYARSYTQWKRLTGPDFTNKSANYDYLKTSVPQFLTQFLRASYLPDAVMIYGAYVDNAAIPDTGEAELIERWNREYEFPKLVCASDAEYFEYIAKNFGEKLPVYRGDCGAYWEDGVGSTAQATRLNRQSQQILPAAETAAALASVFDPRNRYPQEDFRGAWRNVMFYNEHTWGAHNSVSQPGREFVERQWEIKESYAERANLDARSLLARGLNRLSQQVNVEGDTVLAFNWQNYRRSAPLEVELNADQHLVEIASGEAVPLDTISQRDGWKRVRFMATDVPALGYKGYAIRSLRPGSPAVNERKNGATIESAFYRLTVDEQTGGIRSLYDKTENRELLDRIAPYALNEYLYVTGGEGSRILNFNFGTPPASLSVHRSEGARILENTKTPLGARMVVLARSTNTPSIRSEYRLYDTIKRVDIFNTVEKLPTRTKEGVYFAYPFAASQPAFEVQIQNGWCRPNQDQMPGACREWFTPQNLVHLRDGEFDVLWSTPDAPLVCLTDINRGNWPDHLEIKNGHIYSYAMNNYWFTNYRAEQGGTFQYRFSLTSGHAIDRIGMARFDADTRAPVIAYPFVSTFSAAVAKAGRPMAPASGSFLSCNAPNLQVVTFKEAEDGEGYILRLRETAGRSGTAEVQSSTFRIREAWLADGVEVNRSKLASTETSMRFPYKPNRYLTLRIKAESALPARAPERRAAKGAEGE